MHSLSLDPNPIENLWDVLDQEMCITDTQTSCLQQRPEAAVSTRTKVPERRLKRKVDLINKQKKTFLKCFQKSPADSSYIPCLNREHRKQRCCVHARHQTDPTLGCHEVRGALLHHTSHKSKHCLILKRCHAFMLVLFPWPKVFH